MYATLGKNHAPLTYAAIGKEDRITVCVSGSLDGETVSLVIADEESGDGYMVLTMHAHNARSVLASLRVALDR